MTDLVPLLKFIDKIKAALGTEEDGDALVEVARTALKTEAR